MAETNPGRSERESRTDPPDRDCVRSRLLDAAEALFAERGFSASVRDITADAGCNVAAVNYYLGGKDALYRAVFERRLERLRDHRLQRIRTAMSGDGATLETLVRAFTAAFLEPLVVDSDGRRTVRLLSHEMMNPHLPEGMLLDRMVRPVVDALASAMCRVEPKLDETVARRCVHSLVGQLVHTLTIKRHIVAESEHAHDLAEMVEHIVCFSCGGIRACSERSDTREESR